MAVLTVNDKKYWSNNTPNVLKFAKLWSPKCQN